MVKSIHFSLICAVAVHAIAIVVIQMNGGGSQEVKQELVSINARITKQALPQQSNTEKTTTTSNNAWRTAATRGGEANVAIGKASPPLEGESTVAAPEAVVAVVKTIDGTKPIQDLGDSLYFESWMNKIVRIGEATYPKRLQGRLKVSTTIAADGSLKEVVILVPAQSKELNEATMKLIQFASPYSKPVNGKDTTIICWFSFEIV